MVRAIKPVVILAVAGAVTAALYGLAPGSPTISLSESALGGGFGRGYDLAQLKLLESTLYYVEESYVEPGRVDYEDMFVAALEAVERRVPGCMFRREVGGSLLHVEIADFRTTYEVTPVHTRAELQQQLERVARLLQEHLSADQIPTASPDDDPYAEIEYTLVNGVLSTLDPHSILLPPRDSSEMDVENEGEFGGLGITIVLRDGRLTIEYPLADTPAERAGLEADDYISRIDGESTINMSLEEAVSRLRGPVGAPVDLEIKRAGLSEPLQVTVVRDLIELQRVEGQVLEGRIGYVSIKGFHAKVEQQLHEELSRMHRETGGLRGLVLDLRSNPGGFLHQAIAVADTFLDEGVIVSTVDGSNRTLDRELAHSQGTEDRYPIVVLVNANSASASEIVAGALRNQERAVIVGERTFGKGSVQNLYPFFNDSKLKLTISKYLTPHDRSIQSVGIPADIALRPVIVERVEPEPSDAGAEPEDHVYLFLRERVRREADLDHHLERVTTWDDEPAYTVPYWRPYRIPRTAEPDLTQDFEVQFARDVLLATSSWRRSDVLQAAGRVVSTHQRDSDEVITDAFADLGVDWSSGPSQPSADLEVRLDIGTDGTLHAGEDEVVALEVTNRGDVPLYRLVAVAKFENEFLDVREFPIGRLDPGQTRRWEQDVHLPAGYPTERAPARITFRDSGNDALAVHYAYVPVEARPGPSLVWSWEARDEDGDGNVEVGEEVRLHLVVTNEGEGDTVELVGRVKNRSRRALDIVSGTVEPGTMRHPDGSACAPTQPGIEAGAVVGDATSDPQRIERGDPPVYPAECSRSLAAGETWEGDLVVRVEESLDTERQLELTLGDASAYDYASVVRAGFYEYFLNEENLTLTVGEPGPSGERRPPVIEVTQGPGISVDRARVTISGRVTDETGVADVMVYDQIRGETLDGEVVDVLAGNDAMRRADKVFYQGSSAGVPSVPFTADVELEPGLNTLTILATDVDGVHSTRSVVTFYLSPELQAQLDGE